MEELVAVLESVNHEIAVQRAQDTGGDDGKYDTFIVFVIDHLASWQILWLNPVTTVESRVEGSQLIPKFALSKRGVRLTRKWKK